MGYLQKIRSTTDSWDEVTAPFIALGIFEEGTLTSTGNDIDKVLQGQISKAYSLGDIKGKTDEVTLFYHDEKRIAVIGLGKKDKFDAEGARRAAATASRTAIQRKIGDICVENFDTEFVQAIAEGITLGSYQYFDFKTDDEDCFDLKSALVMTENKEAVHRGSVYAQGVCYARDLENAPGNHTTPSRLAESAAEISQAGGMKLTVFDRDEFTEMGMGGMAGVSAGSDEPPKFIILEYYGGEKDEKPKVLVGKGLTFDAGGISIKPAASMDEMKYDMCGSGVVLGVMKAVSVLKPNMNIVGVVPSTENLLGGKAYKPGDILKAYNGKTIEVLNTDAEGRLILADGLSYVSKHYDPEYILDFATLTGAVVISLGHITTGIMGTDEALLDRVRQSSKETAEKVWELPLWDEYCEQIKSKVADVKNVGEARQAGSIAAGAFLKEFVQEGIPWCHFDIAGTAWGKKDSPYYYQKGASGETIRLVLNLMGV